MKTIKCPQCNLVNFSTVSSCKRCDYFFQEVNQEVNLEATENFPAENQPDTFSNPPLQNSNPPNFAAQQQGTPRSQFRPKYEPHFQPIKQKSGLAITSMVLGIVGFVLGCVGGFLLSPIGLIMGIIALVKSNKRPQEYGGNGFAIAGVVLNALLVLAFPLILAIAIPNLLAARRAANEGAAVSSLRNIANAQVTFGSAKNRCGELTELGQNQLIDPVLAGGIKSGYVFVVTRTTNGCDLYAKPTSENGTSATGNRSFLYSGDDGKLRVSNAKGTMPNNASIILEVEGFPPGYSFPPPQIANR